MALIRQVSQNQENKQWAFIEYSDESSNSQVTELGDKTFDTEQEATDYSKGFEPFSYTWVEPRKLKMQRLSEAREVLVHKLAEVDRQINEAFLSDK